MNSSVITKLMCMVPFLMQGRNAGMESNCYYPVSKTLLANIYDMIGFGNATSELHNLHAPIVCSRV